MQELRGRVAVVTGAASGIGLGLARRFAEEGMKVVLADIEQGALDHAAAELEGNGAEVLAVRTDVSKHEQVDRLAAEAYRTFGAVHVVCNNAGVEVVGSMLEHTLADWEWVFGVNLWGVVHGVRAFVPRMLTAGGEGHVVNTASLAGLTSTPYLGVYNITKHGVVALSETLYKELKLADAKVGVSVLCPGAIATNIMRSSRNRPAELADSGAPGESAARMRAGLETAISAGITPAEVADKVVAGVREGKFYILPSRGLAGVIQRVEEVRELRNPSLG